MDGPNESGDEQPLFFRRAEDQELETITAWLEGVRSGPKTGCWEWRHDPDSIYVDEQTVKLLGYESDGLPETYEEFISRVHPDDRDDVEAQCENAGREGVYDAEFRVIDDGEVARWIRARGGAIPGESDAQEKLVGFVTDITPDKERDRELEKFRTIVDHSPDGLTHIRPDGTMTYVSGGERILGRSRAEFVGEPLEKFIHPADTRRALEFFERLRSGDDPTPFEGRMKHADGRWAWVETTAISLDDPSKFEGFLTVTRDVSQRKQYERRLENQRDNLEILNEIIRHDIRNDLHVVAGNAELLEDYVGDPGKKHLNTIRGSTTSATDLIRKARELSETMLGTEDELEGINLPSALRGQIEAVRAEYPDSEITIEGALPETEVVANELLDAVFRNLLKNAIQHNDKEVPNVSVSVESADEEVEVRITDNGPGISDSMIDTLFERAERGRESTGSGIGLHLVRALVERYEGEVWVENATPIGATFVVRLQVA